MQQPAPLTLAAVNALNLDGFVACFGGIVEDAAWLVATVADVRPFADVDAVVAAFHKTFDALDAVGRREIILQHPDLAGRLARAGRLSAESTAEQAGIGLDRLSDEEYERFAGLNCTYTTKFGFPFIAAARAHTRETLIAAFEARVEHTAEAEFKIACAEVRKIMEFRLRDLVVG
jgi:OHCU decarboxylase